MRARLVVVLAVIVGAACQPANTTRDVKSDVEAVNAAFAAAVAANDPAAISMLYTEDAWLMGPNGPSVKGRAAIAEAFTGMLASGIAGVDFTTEEARGNDSVAVEVGRYKLMDASGNVLDDGKFLVWWKHTADGWRFHRDIFNSDMALPSPAPAPVTKK